MTTGSKAGYLADRYKKACWMVVCIIMTATMTARSQTDIYEKQADSLFTEGQYARAAELYMNVYHLLPYSSDRKGNMAFEVAKSYTQLGQAEIAGQYYRKALTIFEQQKKTDAAYITKSRLASILDDQGLYQEAVSIAEECAAYFMKNGDSAGAAVNLNNLALYFYHAGDPRKAIEICTDAIRWVGSHNDMLKAKMYNQLGNIWADDLHDEEKALEYYRKSLWLKLNGASDESVSAAYNNIGLSYKNLGRYDSAFYYYELALQYAMNSGLPMVKFNPLLNIANLYKRQGNMKAAEQEYLRILDMSDSISVKQQVNIYTSLGTLYNEMGDFKKSLYHLEKSATLLGGTGNLTDQAKVEEQKALLYFGLHDYANAYLSQQRLLILTDSIHKRDKAQEVARLMIEHEALEKDKTILESSHLIQAQNLRMQQLVIWLILVITLSLLIAGSIFYLYKKKQASARRTELELKLAEQESLTRIQEERLRISRELHDNIGSYLTFMNATVEQFRDMEAGELKDKIPELRDGLAMSMRELRKTVWLLNRSSVNIDEITLRLRDFFRPFIQTGIQIKVEALGNTELTLGDIQTTHLFRTIQEAVNNACKHASADLILVNFEIRPENQLFFSVADNGTGFDMSAIRYGNGIKNMKYRMEELGGSLEIISVPGKGTVISGIFAV